MLNVRCSYSMGNYFMLCIDPAHLFLFCRGHGGGGGGGEIDLLDKSCYGTTDPYFARHQGDFWCIVST